MTEEELFDTLRPIILTVTGVPECILADPNARAPDGDYAAVRPKKAVGQRGQSNVKLVNKPLSPIDLDTSVKRQVVTEMSIQFYRGGALDYAPKLIDANKRSDISEILFKAKVGWRNVGPVNNLTALQSDSQEPRSQISIFLMYEETDEFSVNSIERVRVDTEYSDGTLVSSFDIETDDAP